MKKVFAIIFALSYLSAYTGTSIDFNYCNGKHISLNAPQKQKALYGNCAMCEKEQKGCCENKHKILQIDKDQKTAESVSRFLKKSFDAIAVTYAQLPLNHHTSIVQEHPASGSPPRATNLPIFMLNCNFRI